jgi:HAD superfamily hydrolase (TIGR01450 family)
LPASIDLEGLLARYEVLLLDAYGVLVDAGGALEGARDLIEAIGRHGRRFLVVTNDASRSPETMSRRFGRLGLSIGPEQIVSSGSLLMPYFAAHGLGGSRCVVLGSDDCREYVRAAGGVVVPLETDDREVRVVVLGLHTGEGLLAALDRVLTICLRKIDRGEALALLLPNPDLIYPSGEGAYGVASGSFAVLLEAAIGIRAPEAAISFVRLGKPNAPIFEAALRRAGCDSSRVVMVGDQLETDIRGARGAGIDSVLVTFGVTRRVEEGLPPELRPTYLLETYCVGRAPSV